MKLKKNAPMVLSLDSCPLNQGSCVGDEAGHGAANVA